MTTTMNDDDDDDAKTRLSSVATCRETARCSVSYGTCLKLILYEG